MQGKTKAAVAAAAVIAVAGFYFMPHLTIHAMKSAAESRDSATLSGYIDFPAVKENLKGTLNAKIAADVAKQDESDPFAAAGAMMVAAFLNPMIDALVTPEAIEMMMRGDKPTAHRGGDSETTQSDKDDIQTEMGYESFDRFVLNVQKKGEEGEPLGLVLKRDGIFSWKLAAVRLPM